MRQCCSQPCAVAWELAGCVFPAAGRNAIIASPLCEPKRLHTEVGSFLRNTILYLHSDDCFTPSSITSMACVRVGVRKTRTRATILWRIVFAEENELLRTAVISVMYSIYKLTHWSER